MAEAEVGDRIKTSMNALKDRWKQLPAGRRVALLALLTAITASLATAALLAQFNVNAILYKGF